MSLHAKLLLILLAWLNSNVAPMRLSRNSRHNGTASNKLRHLADHSMHDSRSTFNGDLDQLRSDATLERGEQYTGRHVNKLKESAKSTSLGMHRDGELGQIDSLDLSLACNDAQTKLSLSDGPQSKGSRGFLSLDVLESCGYAASKGLKNATVVVKDCDVTLANGYCSTRMKYETIDGQLADVTLPCTARSHRSLPNHHHHPSDDLFSSDQVQSDSPSPTQEFKCNVPSQTGLVTPRCRIDQNQRIQCGASGISSSECYDKGCCFDYDDNLCLYPLNECTADRHFVFVVLGNLSDFSLDLTKLKTSGASDCLPRIITADFAVFFFPTTDCGARTYDIGESTISSVEVLTSLSHTPAISGNISRDLQFRLMVECRYAKSQLLDVSSSVTAGFMVKSPTLFPMVQSEGIFSVELRISKDAAYSHFYPSYHPPLRVLLGKSVYLEIRLKSPKPVATLLVHYCIAYPKSATKALVLLHNGCPNPVDNSGVLIIGLPGNRHERRFEVKAFQFMVAPDEYLDEQIYFLCSTELCFHTGSTCEEGCFVVAP
ncbi:zona pellucida sperm-binding protein 4-like [Anguilla rostrata]|uniref:zona pellucida sperm-binding protein 4-like n=1 Tax=Anguilla rostrata TaxID=7938 RepID=UPI0030CE33B0